jgi:hypothetical protein
MMKVSIHMTSAAGMLINATPIEARNTIGEPKDLHVLVRITCVVTVLGSVIAMRYVDP